MLGFLQPIYNQMDSPHLVIAAMPRAAFEFEGFDLNSDVFAPSAGGKYINAASSGRCRWCVLSSLISYLI